jgi:hypothetical protein
MYLLEKDDCGEDELLLIERRQPEYEKCYSRCSKLLEEYFSDMSSNGKPNRDKCDFKLERTEQPLFVISIEERNPVLTFGFSFDGEQYETRIKPHSVKRAWHLTYSKEFVSGGIIINQLQYSNLFGLHPRYSKLFLNAMEGRVYFELRLFLKAMKSCVDPEYNWLTDHETTFDDESENEEQVGKKKTTQKNNSKAKNILGKKKIDERDFDATFGDDEQSIGAKMDGYELLRARVNNSNISTKTNNVLPHSQYLPPQKKHKINNLSIDPDDLCAKFTEVFNNLLTPNGSNAISSLENGMKSIDDMNNTIAIFVQIISIEIISTFCSEKIQEPREKRFKLHLNTIMSEKFKNNQGMTITLKHQDYVDCFKTAWKSFLYTAYNNGKKNIGEFTIFNRTMKVLVNNCLTDSSSFSNFISENEICWEESTLDSEGIFCIITETKINKGSHIWRLNVSKSDKESIYIFTDSVDKRDFCTKLILIINSFTFLIQYCIKRHLQHNYDIYSKTIQSARSEQHSKFIEFVSFYYNTKKDSPYNSSQANTSASSEVSKKIYDGSNMIQSILNCKELQDVKDIIGKINNMVVNSIKKLAMYKSRFKT